MAQETEKDFSFEGAMAEITSIAERLERGDAPLEESLALYERATLLIKRCGAKLDEAEQKVMVLTRDDKGAMTVAPFDKEED